MYYMNNCEQEEQKNKKLVYQMVEKGFIPTNSFLIVYVTDYGHQERAFFQKFEIFGLGQTNWAENL